MDSLLSRGNTWIAVAKVVGQNVHQSCQRAPAFSPILVTAVAVSEFMFAGGWKSSNRSPLPVEGEIFFLDIPFYRSDEMRRPVSGRDAVRSQVIDALEAQEIKETGNEEG